MPKNFKKSNFEFSSTGMLPYFRSIPLTYLSRGKYMIPCCKTPGIFLGAGSIATTAQPITCVNVDSDADCDYWKSLGYCSSSSQYYSYMTQNCPKSCGTCSAPPTQPPCVNSGAADADCNYWAGLGYCATSSVYYTWMIQNCQKACATC